LHLLPLDYALNSAVVCRVRADMMGSAQEMFRRAGIELPPDMMAVHGRWQSSSRPGAANVFPATALNNVVITSV
jgi:hypothetical protein